MIEYGVIWRRALNLLQFRLLKLMAVSGIMAKVFGEFISSNGQLTYGVYIKDFALLRLICNRISRSLYIYAPEHLFAQQSIDDDILRKVEWKVVGAVQK